MYRPEHRHGSDRRYLQKDAEHVVQDEKKNWPTLTITEYVNKYVG